MQRFTTEADAGSVLIGNDLMRYQVHNGYGDGIVCVYTDVTHLDKEELKARYNVDEWRLEGVTHGVTCIFPYDCLYNHETGDLVTELPVTTLKGRYAIYSGRGMFLDRGVVIFEKWA